MVTTRSRRATQIFAAPQKPPPWATSTTLRAIIAAIRYVVEVQHWHESALLFNPHVQVNDVTLGMIAQKGVYVDHLVTFFLSTVVDPTIWCVAAYILQAVVRFFVLPLVRLYIETIGRAYRRVWYKMPHPLSIDGYHPLAHISLERAVRYGSGPAEVMDVLRPTADTAAAVGDAPGFEQVVVYLHGGGFVACNSEVLLHSLPCPLARAGFSVYSIDYPLAPEDAFPSAPLSTIRALRHIKEAYTGTDEVVLIGDSAGQINSLPFDWT